MKRNGDVDRALELLRSGRVKTIAEACRRTGAAKSTVSDNWRKEIPPAAHVPDDLGEFPTERSEIPVFVRDYSDQEYHRIYPIGDLHIGSPEHAGSALDGWLNYLVETPETSMLNTGDNTNCAITTSVSDTYSEVLTVGEARELQTDKFRPLAQANKIDAVIDGNHEMRIWRAIGDSPNAAVCSALGLNYSMAACVVRYLVGDQQYDVYLRHGTGGGSTMGAAVNRLEKQERIIDADIYVSGHTHTQVAFPKDTFAPNDSGGFSRRKRLFVCSGSFLSYEDYAASAGFPPAHIGAPRIFLDGRHKDAHASV